MHGFAVLIVAAAVGVEYGWQKMDDGQVEYIIQVEPALLDSLAEGAPIFSEIHPDVRGVRRFRIQVGSGALPKEDVVIVPPDAPLIVPPPTAPLAQRNADNVVLPNGDKVPRGAFPPIQPPPVSPPREFVAEPPGSPLVRPTAGFTEAPKENETANGNAPANQQVRGGEDSPNDKKLNLSESSTVAQADPPWLPLVLTMFLLFASVGGNVYLGWIARNFYLRCRALTREARSAVGQVS